MKEAITFYGLSKLPSMNDHYDDRDTICLGRPVTFLIFCNNKTASL